ncbi:MAG: hypothetical protein K5841_07245 [Fretibacterium sp.]|nr:hypothetical protein [Fretibacterium sp.]
MYEIEITGRDFAIVLENNAMARAFVERLPLTLTGRLCRERSLQFHDGVKEQFVALA